MRQRKKVVKTRQESSPIQNYLNSVDEGYKRAISILLWLF